VAPAAQAGQQRHHVEVLGDEKATTAIGFLGGRWRSTVATTSASSA
jgi:hypothetical protein